MKTEGEKTKRSLLVRQDDQWVKAYFTKATPNGLPAFKKITKKSGKVEWDKENFLEFLENIILNEFKPIVTNNRPSTAKEPVADEDGVVINSEEDTEVNDDLPF